ncbi:MAG TPA: VOC family protein [Ktedonobacteraceae bacterium]|nr:VOC family protein [Ktedonobacteraceae bacterium]
MLTGLDHVIIGVHNLAEATRTFGEKLGLVASGGGVHPTGGTANRIIVIGNTYLELISVRAPEEAQPNMLARLARGEGYLNCVLATDDMQADSEGMRRRGVALIGPNQGSLTSADGRSRGWTRTDIERPDLAQHYPFIIQHDSSGEERRLRLAGWQTPPEHPLGAVRVLSTTIAVADPAEATTRFQHIYGLEPSPPFSGADEGWNATLVVFPLGNGTQQLELAAIRDDSTREEMPFSDIAQHVQQFGEGVCRMTVVVKDLVAATRYLTARGVGYTYREEPRSLVWIHPDEACGAAIVLREA